MLFLRAPIRERLPRLADLSIWRAEIAQSRALQTLYIFRWWSALIGGHFPGFLRVQSLGLVQVIGLWERQNICFFPKIWDSHWSQSYDESFEMRHLMSFGADIVTLGKSWSLSLPLHLPTHPRPQCPTYTMYVWSWSCFCLFVCVLVCSFTKLSFRFGTD